MYLLGVLVVAVGVGASIALHELGHLLPAKRFGVKCTHYMIGFGPTIWSRQVGETRYGFKAIPLGGFVRMIGMFPPKPGADPSVLRASSTGRWSAMVDDARAQSQEEIQPGDEDRVFYKLSTPKKIITMLGGPTMNLLIAVAILTALVTLHGRAMPVDGTRVVSVVACVRNSDTAAQGPATTCTSADKPSPAAAAGLRPGDEIVSVNGTPVSSTTQISQAIRPKPGQTLSVVVRRDGAERTLTMTPIEGMLPAYDAQGAPVVGPDGKPVIEKVGYVGMTNQQRVEVVRQPVTAVPAVVWQALSGTAGVVLKLPQKMVDVWNAAFGPQERDINGPISIVGIGRVAGEVADGQIQGITGTSDILVTLISLVASLNIALFVFNLIPLLPLDGGHVIGALWEGLKRSAAKLTGRPDPGYVDVAKGLPIAYAVSIVLIGMSALLIYADLVKPISF